MPARIALIHTSPSMIPVFKGLVEELLAGVDLFNVVDESLLCDIIREGKCPPATARRLVGHVLAATDAGATHVLVTCSSMGHAVDAARGLCPAVVLRVDDPMAREAVRRGSTIGVIATLPSTLHPTAELIRSIAATEGKSVQILTRVVEGAFAAVVGGRGAEHDALVSAALEEMTGQADVIVLAQASMARVVESLPPSGRSKPILSSPRMAVEHLAKLLQR